MQSRLDAKYAESYSNGPMTLSALPKESTDGYSSPSVSIDLSDRLPGAREKRLGQTSPPQVTAGQSNLLVGHPDHVAFLKTSCCGNTGESQLTEGRQDNPKRSFNLFWIMVSIWVFKHLRRGSWRGLSPGRVSG